MLQILTKILRGCNEHLKGDVTLKNISDEVGQLAIQGPKAESYSTKINGH